MDKLFVAAIKEETVGLDYFKHIGVGKINATYNTLKLIQIYKPKIIVNYGTAGAINTKLKGIVECTKFYQRDMDVRGLDFKLGETPFDKVKYLLLLSGPKPAPLTTMFRAASLRLSHLHFGPTVRNRSTHQRDGR